MNKQDKAIRGFEPGEGTGEGPPKAFTHAHTTHALPFPPASPYGVRTEEQRAQLEDKARAHEMERKYPAQKRQERREERTEADS